MPHPDDGEVHCLACKRDLNLSDKNCPTCGSTRLSNPERVWVAFDADMCMFMGEEYTREEWHAASVKVGEGKRQGERFTFGEIKQMVALIRNRRRR